jgi:hypothetical protein
MADYVKFGTKMVKIDSISCIEVDHANGTAVVYIGDTCQIKASYYTEHHMFQDIAKYYEYISINKILTYYNE